MHIARAMEASGHLRRKGRKERNRHLLPSIGDDLEVVEGDKVARTEGEENKRRRTIILQRNDGSWGFTLQSYGIHHRKFDEVELLTYVDYVEYASPSYLAGLRPGDVILSINGTNMEEADHMALVEFIKKCGNTMRMVVLFEDCCRKVELHLRYIRLKRVLAEKVFELRSLEQQERRVLGGFSRFDSCRSSIASSSSSQCSVFEDRLSLRPELDLCYEHMLSSKDADTSFENSPAPMLAQRFNFDRASLPISSRLKPSLRSTHSLSSFDSSLVASSASPPVRRPRDPFSSLPRGVKLNTSHSFTGLPSKRPSSMNFQRSHNFRDSLSPELRIPIPEDQPTPLRRHASTPDKLGPEESMEMDLYHMSINKETDKKLVRVHSDENIHNKSLDSTTTTDSTSNQSSDGATIENVSNKSVDGAVSGATSSLHDEPPEEDKRRKKIFYRVRKGRKSKKPKSRTTWYDSPFEDGIDSDPEFITSTSRGENSLTSTPSSKTDPVNLVKGLVHNTESPCRQVRRSSSFSDQQSSPFRLDDSAISRFSYSDLPCMTMHFVNERDEVTKL